jgi:hypothetical protein
MRGFLRAVLRLVLMALVMAAVLVAATALGLPTAAALGLSIALAGLAGMLGLSRRADPGPARARRRFGGVKGAAPSGSPASAAAATPDPDAPVDPLVESMNPVEAVDPEMLMPRWRRPSLLEARRADPLRMTSQGNRSPHRFAPGDEVPTSRRVVRYAVVALLDRPDEVLGRQRADLQAGDEVEVLEATGVFWQVTCPDGLTGWVHRTTLGPASAEPSGFGRRLADAANEPDDLLTAVLSARGIQ